MAARDRIGVDISDIKDQIESCRNDAAWRELSLAGKVRTLTIERLEVLRAGGDIAQQSETLELLLGFLNYLIDHCDHDGYSLAEISQVLGRDSDRELVAMVKKLQDGSVVKSKAAKS